MTTSGYPLSCSNAAQFVELAAAILCAGSLKNAAAVLQNRHGVGRAQSVCADPIAKAAVGGEVSSTWATGDGKILADAFLETLRPVSLLDAVAQFAAPVPHDTTGKVIGGGTAKARSESAPIAVTKLNVSDETLTEESIAAIVVITENFIRRGGDAVLVLVQRELSAAVARTTNTAFLSALSKTSVSGGSDTLTNLHTGLDALPDCNAVIVAASYKQARELAMQSEGRMGVAGGAFLPNLIVVPCDVINLSLIPADRLLLDAGTLRLSGSSDASVQMSDAPTSGAAQVVSLFQTGSRGVLALRDFAVHGEYVEVA